MEKNTILIFLFVAFLGLIGLDLRSEADIDNNRPNSPVQTEAVEVISQCKSVEYYDSVFDGYMNAYAGAEVIPFNHNVYYGYFAYYPATDKLFGIFKEVKSTKLNDCSFYFLKPLNKTEQIELAKKQIEGNVN